MLQAKRTVGPSSESKVRECVEEGDDAVRGLLVMAEPAEERTVSGLLVTPGQAEEDSLPPEPAMAGWEEGDNWLPDRAFAAVEAEDSYDAGLERQWELEAAHSIAAGLLEEKMLAAAHTAAAVAAAVVEGEDRRLLMQQHVSLAILENWKTSWNKPGPPEPGGGG
jgi:hypothetical protein